MRFLFDPAGQRPGGLRLVGEIPDYKICHLEGRNGAGKSLALRLLELISGQQPYAVTPAAWASLRACLGNTTVTIEELGGSTLRVKLIPDKWPLTPEPVGEWLGEATIDGRGVAISEISASLRVIRIAGDETFERTVHHRLMAEGATVARAHQHFLAQHRDLEALLNVVAEETSVVQPALEVWTRLELLNSEITAGEQNIRGLHEELTVLTDAMLAQNRLAALSGQLPELERRLSEVEARRRELEARLNTLETRRDELLASLAGGSEFEEQIRSTERIRERRLGRFNKAASTLQQSAAALQVDPDPGAIERAIEDSNAELSLVVAKLTSAGHNDAVRELADSLTSDLESFPEAASEVIAILPPSTEFLRITAGDLQIAIGRRQVELSEIDDNPLLKQLDARRSSLLDRIERLSSLNALFSRYARAEELLKKGEADLTALVARARAAGALREEYDRTTSETADTAQALREALAEETRLRVQLDQLSVGESREGLLEQLDKAFAQLGITEAELPARHEAANRADEQHRARLRALKSEQLDLQRLSALHQTEIAQAAKTLASEFWLPHPLQVLLNAESIEERAQALRRLKTLADSIRDSLYRVRDRFDQLLAAADELAAEVGRRGRSSSQIALLPELATEMGSRLRNEFDQHEIRLALFDGGRLESVDLRTLEARWVTDSGELRIRPFEAFSSGEQVFAYTRARIGRVATVDARHRVIALDEFGAFLARDRLERLAQYLRNAVVGEIADQVIIVVPLAADYGTQIPMTTGELEERFRRRAAAIEARSYFVEDASARELV